MEVNHVEPESVPDNDSTANIDCLDVNSTKDVDSNPKEVIPFHGSSVFKMPFAGPSGLVKQKMSSKSAAAFAVSDEVTKLPAAIDKPESSKPLTEEEQKIVVVATSEQDAKYTKDPVKRKEEKSKRVQKDISSERLKKSSIPSLADNADYKEPTWGGGSDELYFFESVKNGTVTDKYDLTTKSFHVFGRLPSCDHSMDHPSLSRHHAIIQHCSVATPTHAVGWYLYDLDSTHGTWINKHKVSPRVYCRLRVGYVIKFGGSSRLYILQGPMEDQEEESELSVNEMKAQRERQINEVDLLRRMDTIEAEEMTRLKESSTKDTGCSWGFSEDDDGVTAEDSDAPNPYAATDNEMLYLDDPKKALRGFYEREGFDQPSYEFTDEGKGKFRCYVELPVDSPNGDPIVAEVTTVGKKKDLVVACALEACRILDRLGLLRKAAQESRGKKRKNWEESNYYDSDEDSYWDRTGELEQKREKRIMRTKKSETKAETFESLTAKLEEARNEKESIEKRLAEDKAARATVEEEGLDELDAFMMSIKSGDTLDVKTKTQMKHRVVILRQQVLRLEQLVKLATPALSSLNMLNRGLESAKTATLPTVGRMKCPAKATRPILPVLPQATATVDTSEDNIVEEEEEEEDDNGDCNQSAVVMTTSTMSTSNSSSIDSLTAKCTSPAQVLASSSIPKVITKNDKSVSKTEVSKRIVPQTSQAMETSNVLINTRNETVTSLERTASNVPKKRVWNETSKTIEKLSSVEFGADPSYNVWLPPSNQSGDGKTELNKKLGY